LVSAAHIIAVDPVEMRREMAMRLGATDAVATMDEATDIARGLTNGQGVDAAIVTVGVTTGEHLAQAFAGIRKAGTVVATGVGSDIGIPVSVLELAM
jgi:threonine dehydrogenase-like Zn-dependent dehydrogenase